MSNTHDQIAQLRAGGVHEWQADEGSTDATNIAAIIDAQVEATLALAYEQRTANLIAMFQLPDMPYKGGTTGISEDKRQELYMEVAERLGFMRDA